MKDNGRIVQWWTVPRDDGGELELRHVEVPPVGPGEVLVKVWAAGVNRGELIARLALRKENPSARPHASGIECAGELAVLGEGVDGHALGDKDVF